MVMRSPSNTPTNDELSTPRIISLDVSNETKAVARFFNTFAPPGTASNHGGAFDFLAPLYQEATTSSVIHVTVDAVALLMTARNPGCDFLKKNAYRKHGIALIKLREALDDPKMSKSDNTLVSTMLLSTFEVSSGRGTLFTLPVSVENKAIQTKKLSTITALQRLNRGNRELW